MFGDRFSSSTTCSKWRHETEPGRLDQSLSCRFWKVATHPFCMLHLRVGIEIDDGEDLLVGSSVNGVPEIRQVSRCFRNQVLVAAR